MIYLLTQMFFCLVLATVAGGAVGWLSHRARAGRDDEALRETIVRQHHQLRHAETDVAMLTDDFDDLKQRSQGELESLRGEVRRLPALVQNLDKSQTLVRQLMQKHEAQLRELGQRNDILRERLAGQDEREAVLARTRSELETARNELGARIGVGGASGTAHGAAAVAAVPAVPEAPAVPDLPVPPDEPIVLDAPRDVAVATKDVASQAPRSSAPAGSSAKPSRTGVIMTPVARPVAARVDAVGMRTAPGPADADAVSSRAAAPSPAGARPRVIRVSRVGVAVVAVDDPAPADALPPVSRERAPPSGIAVDVDRPGTAGPAPPSAPRDPGHRPEAANGTAAPTARQGSGRQLAPVHAAAVPMLPDTFASDDDPFEREDFDDRFDGAEEDDDEDPYDDGLLDDSVELMFEPVDRQDDLQRIFGIGPVTERALNRLGITSYSQIADLESHDVERIADALQIYSGRIERDDWVGNARRQLEDVLEEL